MLLSRIKALFQKKTGEPTTGRVKFFNRRRGYGFIESDHPKRDIFVHVKDLQDFISKGDRVAFIIEPSSKGLEAKNVKLVRN